MLVLAFCVSLGFYSYVHSDALDNVSGYAWEADDWTDLNSNGAQDAGEEMNPPGGMGWLSFNCTGDSPACAQSDYGVNIDSSGNITGHAWTPNYGWLKFGGLGANICPPLPSGPGTNCSNAKVSGNTVIGWARFCAPTSNPGACAGFVSNLINGGWDGWVSLSGTTTGGQAYGVTYDTATGIFGGYAWGGSDVVGWLDFSKVATTPIGSTPSVTITANAQTGTSTNPVPVSQGSNINLSWLSSGMTSCTASSSNDSRWPGVSPFSKATNSTQILTTSTLVVGTIYQYHIDCTGGSGSDSDEVYVRIVPVSRALELQSTYSPAYPQVLSAGGPVLYQTTLQWLSTDTTGSALTGCVASGQDNFGNAVPSWSGSVADAPIITSSPYPSAVADVPTNPTTYDLKCHDPADLDMTHWIFASSLSVPRGSVTEDITSFSSTTVDNTRAIATTTLTWEATNIKSGSCVASSTDASGQPVSTTWSGSVAGGINISTDTNPTTDFQTNVIVPKIAPAFTTYTIDCIGLFTGSHRTRSLDLNENSTQEDAPGTPIIVEG